MVAAYLLKPVGRKLKCMKCGAVWPTVPEGNRKNPCNEDAHHSSPASVALVHRAESEETASEDSEDVHANRKSVREDRCTFEKEETAKSKIAAEQVFAVENITSQEQLYKPASVTVSYSEDNDHDVQKNNSSAASDTVHAEPPIVGSSAKIHDAPYDSPEKTVPNGNTDPIPSVFSKGFKSFPQKREKKRSHNLIMSIVVGVGALTAGAGVAWYGQVQMFEGWWPALRDHLTDLGFPVIDLISSLEFSDITALMTLEKNIKILIVRGTIQNIAPVPVNLPSMYLLFRDTNRRVVRKGEATDLSIPILLPGERTQFILKLQNPPIGTTVDIGLDRK